MTTETNIIDHFAYISFHLNQITQVCRPVPRCQPFLKSQLDLLVVCSIFLREAADIMGTDKRQEKFLSWKYSKNRQKSSLRHLLTFLLVINFMFVTHKGAYLLVKVVCKAGRTKLEIRTHTKIASHLLLPEVENAPITATASQKGTEGRVTT